METHLHNDYVTGGLELVKRTGAAYAVQGREVVAFERCSVDDGDILNAGILEVHVLETPGHTENHVSYVIGYHGEATAVFSSGSLLYDAVGRTVSGPAPKLRVTAAGEPPKSVGEAEVAGLEGEQELHAVPARVQPAAGQVLHPSEPLTERVAVDAELRGSLLPGPVVFQERAEGGGQRLTPGACVIQRPQHRAGVRRNRTGGADVQREQ